MYVHKYTKFTFTPNNGASCSLPCCVCRPYLRRSPSRIYT